MDNKNDKSLTFLEACDRLMVYDGGISEDALKSQRLAIANDFALVMSIRLNEVAPHLQGPLADMKAAIMSLGGTSYADYSGSARATLQHV